MEHGIANATVSKCQTKRMEDGREAVLKNGVPVPLARQSLQRVTQRSIRFVRRLRMVLLSLAPWNRMLEFIPRRHATNRTEILDMIADGPNVPSLSLPPRRGATGTSWRGDDPPLPSDPQASFQLLEFRAQAGHLRLQRGDAIRRWWNDGPGRGRRRIRRRFPA